MTLRPLLAGVALAGSLAMATALPAIADDATIAPEAPILTMINVLTPGVDGQDALVAQLQLALEGTLSKTPGFISGSVHRSLDSNHVVNYAQWSDQASLEAFVARLQSGDAPAMAAVFAMATPDFHPYSVVSVTRGQEAN